ncbi:hypothetical protein V1264_023466 [Littorina saxatilis]
MLRLKMLILLSIVVSSVFPCAASDDKRNFTEGFYFGVMPENFTWGVSTAAFQIEGAWNEDGKSESIWDRFSHEGGHIALNQTADVSCDSYHKWRDDITILKELGVKHYRFSLSWSRIVPDPTTGEVNQAGVNFYLNLITALKEAGIEPMVTLFHWDLPQILEDNGSWGNETIIQQYKHYADVAFSHFGYWVKYWLTFNEPWVVTWSGYGIGEYAPGIKQPATLPYLYAHTIIKCHAQAWHLYDTTYRPRFNGMVSITLNTDFFAPKNSSKPEDVEAAERAAQFSVGWFAHPIYVDGDYPQVMKDYVQRNTNSTDGSSRLPKFTDSEKLFIKGTFDYFGLNHYSTSLCEPADAAYQASVPKGYLGDMEVKLTRDPKWQKSSSSYLYYVPWGMRGILNFIRTNYNNTPVIVTENGVTDRNGTLLDFFRIQYIRAYINELTKAALIDNCNVIGYTVWSIMDNFEWTSGYTQKFGLYYVDFDNPQRPRVAKQSGTWYKGVIADHGFPDPMFPPKDDLRRTT